MRTALRSVSVIRLTAVMCSSVVVWGCGAAGQSGADWPPISKRWFDRGDASFRQGDLDDAETASENALRVTPDREEVRLLAARIALAKLEFDRTIQVLKGIESTEARSLRGRAYWYSGEIDKAADELERLVADPEVRDPWAAEIAKLARQGTGRKPFEMTGGLLAVTDMPRTGTAAMIVPLEINGEPGLGLIATGEGEAVIDSASGAQPSWVSLRFGERLEVRDVPARAKDLSGISRQVNAPIKILLGVNLLRHLHPTFDLIGGQFVVRSYEPPPPPAATTLKLSYVRGGGMLIRGAFGADASAAQCSLLVDTSIVYPVALDSAGWKKAGVAPSSLRSIPNGGALKQGTVPLLKLGAYDLPSVPGLSGDEPVKEREEGLGIELDGLVGSGLLANFRVTLADAGRTMWLEDMPRQVVEPPSQAVNAPVEEQDDSSDDATDDDDDAPSGKPGKPGATKAGTKSGTAKQESKSGAPTAKPAAKAPSTPAKAPAKP
ncbi:MAG TPA: hypothetical protein VK745_23110 [Polyangiaceae bacterium]|nr:hypothetical protein [Polyangiaceae bacterium]